MKMIIILLLVVLLASTAFGAYSIYTSSQTPVLTTPLASSFVPADWMSFIPNGTTAFRFLNLSYIFTYPNLFSNSIILSNDTSPVNLMLFDATFEVDMQIGNLPTASVVGLNGTSYSDASAAFASSNLTKLSYDNVILYRIDNFTGSGPAWMCFFNGALVVAGGDLDAVMALQSIVNAASAPYFNNDSLKSGCLLVVAPGPSYAFSCYQYGNNTYTINFEMRSLTNSGSSSIVVRDLYYFSTVGALNSNFNSVKSAFFSSGQTIYTSGSFMIGDQTYSKSNMTNALSSIG